MAQLRVLVVEDDPLFVRTLQLQLGAAPRDGKAGFALSFVPDAALALQQLQAHAFDAVLLDLHLGEHEHGLLALPKLVAAAPKVPIVVHSVATDHATIVQAMRAGAYDYVPKHVGVHTLAEQLRGLTLQARAAAQPSAPEAQAGPARKRGGKSAASPLPPKPGSQGPLAQMVGDSAPMHALRHQLDVAARSRGNVLIHGESGAGKELVARALARRGEPFVAVDAATLEGALAASVLFGHERGAFTGADAPRIGLFERAHGGTLYFDEVANMPLDVQAKLLRALQEREVWPLGAKAPRALQFRLVCATNADLVERVRQGRFRADLLTRMQVFVFQVPPLRERPNDVPALFAHLLARHGGAGRGWDSAVARALARCPFAGNVRELESAAIVALAHAEADADVGDGDPLRPEHLPPALAAYAATVLPPEVRRRGEEAVAAARAALDPLEGTDATAMPAMPEATRDFYAQVRAFERRTLIRAFAEHRGNISAMARTLGMDRSSLYAKLRLYAIHVPRAG